MGRSKEKRDQEKKNGKEKKRKKEEKRKKEKERRKEKIRLSNFLEIVIDNLYLLFYYRVIKIEDINYTMK
jgi:hypothetical protein